MVRVVGVRFKAAGKVYYFDPAEFEIVAGAKVVVETARGVEYGDVAVGPKDVGEDQVVQPLKRVLRVGTDKDATVYDENKRREREAFSAAQKKIESHSLEMNLVDVEYTFDGSKIIFYFTAEGRIDFRELVRDLAGMFRTRIEMRQIGVRDEAKLLGGIGPCGRILCCTSFLGDFAPVSIRMAKDQNLSLNPSKISGLCGRLMCCLRYEQETYEAAKKDPTLAPGYVPPVVADLAEPGVERLEDRLEPVGGRREGFSPRIAAAAGLGVTERPQRRPQSPSPEPRRPAEAPRSGEAPRPAEPAGERPSRPPVEGGPQRPQGGGGRPHGQRQPQQGQQGQGGERRERQAGPGGQQRQPRPQQQGQQPGQQQGQQPRHHHPRPKQAGADGQAQPNGQQQQQQQPRQRPPQGDRQARPHPAPGAGQGGPNGGQPGPNGGQPGPSGGQGGPTGEGGQARRNRRNRHRRRGGGGPKPDGGPTPPQA